MVRISRLSPSRFPSPFIIAPALIACLLVMSFGSGSVAFAGDKTRNNAERALRDGEYALAETLFREVLAKNSRDKAARLGLSYTLLKMRRLADAYDHAARVIALDPLSARAHSLLGTALLAGGDFRMSVEELRTALSLKDDEPLAVAGLAMVDFYENRMNSCLAGLRRAIYLNSSEPDFVFALAQAAARSERYKEAADAYERFLIIAPRTDEDRRARIRGLIDFLRYLGAQTSLYNVSGASRTSVPFEMPNNRPIISVRVNGRKEPLRFVLDTGSGISVISDETAKALNVKAVARGGMARAVGGKFEIVYGFLQSMELGEARIENVPVYIRHFYNDEIPVDGYIGLAVINKYFTTVDYGTRSFTLTRQRPGEDNDAPVTVGGIEIPIRITSSGFLSGEVQVDGVSRAFNFIIDTGASISVVSAKTMELDEMSNFKHPARMRVYGAAGIADDVQTLVLPRIVFGPHAREKVDVAVLDLEPVNETTGFIQSGIIGGNFLSHFRVTFDFRKSVLWLEPLNATASIIDRESQPGVAPAVVEPL
ncbi:MAG TPA: aspartyl protease family protein [Pyrinomonadaceae bacterium]|nr:aspartyl protease family protein [Pyrinomonadaceae bacterium]